MNNNIHRTLRKVYLLHNISEHTVGLGADLSRPYNRLLLLSRRLAKLL